MRKSYASFRERKNLTQKELGDILNVTKANISKYENGKLEPNLETHKNISSFFQVTTDFLLNESIIYAKESEKKQIGNAIIQFLIAKDVLNDGEDFTEDKKELLLNLLDKTIDMWRM